MHIFYIFKKPKDNFLHFFLKDGLNYSLIIKFAKAQKAMKLTDLQYCPKMKSRVFNTISTLESFYSMFPNDFLDYGLGISIYWTKLYRIQRWEQMIVLHCSACLINISHSSHADML